ncbi:hydantoinase B/oxoprolinase family protein [Bradyrhizobium manausense]|uniref:hydantoinase B/oxoprolinase family protein n=1 Tax=Bradyrhizobium manausense TaxID=989370 RepID=UPI001BADA001|nr:hydantoinase B/oxoprolinase family protein [Bradyrhizobium manausense]MBR0828637.1 hydantoinase B/oxoprolinase family protein [Bradyrhizobium manausense]
MSGTDTGSIDPVTLELVWARLISAVDEAATAIVRTSFSTLSNEANDFACVLTDAEGRSLAQNTGSIPSFIGTLPATVRAVCATIGVENICPGDVFATNNPWIGTGHLNDISVVRPVFYDGRIVAFAATTSHVPDIGGRIRSTDARELFEEGFQIPLMRILRDEVIDATFIRLLRENVRTPDQTEGDLWAQIGAVTLIEQRVQHTLDDHRLATLSLVASEIFDRSEAEMRRRLRDLPEGCWRYEMRTDGLDEPFLLAASVTLRDGSVFVDFNGTSSQQPRSVNCVLAYTSAMVNFAIKALLLPELPNNEGIFRPVVVTAPEGCLLNPNFPAAVGGRSSTGHYVPVVIFGALAPIIPEKVRAAPGSPLWVLNISGTTASGQPFANVLFFNGGTGAGARQKGADCLPWPSNISATPVEVAERTAPVLIHRKILRDGSGGDGAQRGGRGQEIVIENEGSNVSAVLMTERLRFGAPGLFGGADGAVGEVLIDGVPIETRSQKVLRKGALITMRTPGGGGYGKATGEVG